MTVIIAGSANMDIVAYAERHPRRGETLQGYGLKLSPGGKGANQAVAAAKMGATTKLIARIGVDSFGDDVQRFLAAQGVDLSLLQRTAEAPTGIALIVVAGSGENTIVIVSGANGLLAPGDVESAQINPGSILVSQFEIPEETILRFFQRGKQQNALTMLNMAPAKPCSRELLELSDILVVNETELGILLEANGGGDSPFSGVWPEQIVRAAEEARLPGQRAVVVTLGENGAIAAAVEGVVVVPGREVDAIDTTGAGDCFVGTLAAGLASRWSLEAAMNVANAAAALCTQRAGAGVSMPSSDEVNRLVGTPQSP